MNVSDEKRKRFLDFSVASLHNCHYKILMYYPCRHENLELVKGDACDVESFAATLDGKDAVLSSLGVYANIFNPTTFYSESMFAILDGMKRYI